MHPLCCRVSLCSLAAQSIELCAAAALSRRECINSDKLLDGESNFFSVKSGASHAAERIKVISHSHAAKFIHSPLLYYPHGTASNGNTRNAAPRRDSEASDIRH
jgi:hypothetical protein